jgi:hypothetical protein
MSSAFLGAYWQSREENRDACAARISSFLERAASVNSELSTWVLKGRVRKSSLAPIELSPAAISSILKSNNRDTTGEPMRELGFSFGVWNGSTTGFSGTVGAFARGLKNHVLLETDLALNEDSWHRIAGLVAEAFDPDSMIVSSKEAGEWLKYSRP